MVCSARSFQPALFLVPILGCSGISNDPLNLRWNPDGEICHPEVIECDLGAIHAAYPQCRALLPPDSEERIVGSSPEDKPFYDCVEAWAQDCRERTTDVPAAIQLYDESGDVTRLPVFVPKEGLPVETIRTSEQRVEVRLKSGERGWVDRWTKCSFYMKEDPF